LLVRTLNGTLHTSSVVRRTYWNRRPSAEVFVRRMAC